MDYAHELEIHHNRRSTYSSLDEAWADSCTDVQASSEDLVQAVQELISRLPSDTYEAFRMALNSIERPPVRPHDGREDARD